MSYKYEINEKYQTLLPEVLNIRESFNSNNKTIHKARNELKILDIQSTATVVKSFKVLSLFNRFIYSFFRDSKAKKSYRFSQKIGSFTPDPIAYIEFYHLGLLRESYFISKKFDYDFTIREPLLDESFTDRKGILEAFARFTLELHNNNIFHNDYSPGNILVKKSSQGYEFKIVDINRMKFYKLCDDDRARNFSKLWANEDDLKIIANEYIKYHEIDDTFIQKVIDFSNKHKAFKNFKKRLKGKKVAD